MCGVRGALGAAGFARVDRRSLLVGDLHVVVEDRRLLDLDVLHGVHDVLGDVVGDGVVGDGAAARQRDGGGGAADGGKGSKGAGMSKERKGSCKGGLKGSKGSANPEPEPWP